MSSVQHKMGVADYHTLCKCTSPSHFALYISCTLSGLTLLPNPLSDPSFFLPHSSLPLFLLLSLSFSLSLRAASLGHFEVLQVLSAYGADFTVTTSTGDTAVHFATIANRLLCIRFLGQRGLCGGVLCFSKEGKKWGKISAGEEKRGEGFPAGAERSPQGEVV